jgi:hypothetical protein
MTDVEITRNLTIDLCTQNTAVSIGAVPCFHLISVVARIFQKVSSHR